MAMTVQQQNHVARILDLSQQVIALKQQIDVLRTEWDQNDVYNQLDNSELESVAAYAHLTISKLGNAMGTLTGVRDYLGDYVTGPIVALTLTRG